MPILRPFRLATPPAPRRAHSSPPVSAILALTIGLALCALACNTKNTIVDQLCPASPHERSAESPAMTAMEFCQLYLQTCIGMNSPPGTYITEAECQDAYSGLMFDSTRDCRSYHLCNSALYDTMNAAVHCRHTVGLDLCADTGP